ncbi:ATP-binding protein [Paraburkholderia sprentiae]|uniref:ATP-binding protein n=1 Tax=Paraburkholderia sprentiae TaxID=948107 RepID=UPI001E5B38B1|nr:AAA family ATPase [Paraburkholderia sprentiae]
MGYLVMSDGAIHRSALCDLLWDGPDDPRAALRWSLSKLRPLVDDASQERIVANRTHVAFHAAGAFVDSQRIGALLESGTERLPVAALAEAAQLLGGDFLGGLELPGCYRFHNWCVGQRERFGRIRGAVLRSLIARLSCNVPLALQYGRELVETNPLDGSAHATLIGLLEADGRPSDADGHHRYAHELLHRELGARASAMLDDAVRRMRHTTLLRNTNEYCHRALRDENRPSTDDAGAAERSERAPTRDQQSMSPLPPLPLVGRDAERAKLDVLLAPSTAHGLTLLTGESGIGKTRLLEYFSQCASNASYRVLRGRCYEAEVIRPYGIWIDALREVAMDALEPLDQHLAPFIRPATVGTPQIQRDEGSRERFFNAVVTLLGRLCVDHRLAFVLDDLQWLDKSSGALLHFVLRRLDPELPVVFAAGARPAEMEDNRFARVLLQSLARDGRLTRVPLQPLSANEVGALIRAAGSDIRVEQALRDSGGNPLYVLELTRAKQMDREASTCTVDTLMADRLAPLDAPTRDLLSFAASIGHAFAPEQLAQLLDRALPDILSSIVELQRRGILAEATSTEFDFAHDLVRQTVYRTLSQPHRRAIHHQIARQLLAASVHDPQLHGEVVHHAMLAGDSRMTARACVEASHHCLRVFAATEARAVAERGLAHARSLPQGSERVQLEIQLLTARLVAVASSGDGYAVSMEHEFERAIHEAEALSLHADVVQGLHSLSWLTQQANDIERTRQVTIRAETAARKADAATRCKQLANTGRCLLELERDLPRARGVLQEAGVLAGRLDLRVVELMWGQALLARADGELDIGCAKLDEAVAQARAMGDHWREYQCLVWLATMKFERGAYLDVTRLAADIVAAAQKMGDSGAPFAEVISQISALRLAEGDHRMFVFEGLDALRQADDKRHLCYALNEVARACLDCRCSADASDLGRQALQAADALGSLTEKIVATALLIEAAFAADETERSNRFLSSLRELLGDKPLAPRSRAALQRLYDRYPGTTTIVQTQTH